jgi:hypothetical protein
VADQAASNALTADTCRAIADRLGFNRRRTDVFWLNSARMHSYAAVSLDPAVLKRMRPNEAFVVSGLAAAEAKRTLANPEAVDGPDAATPQMTLAVASKVLRGLQMPVLDGTLDFTAALNARQAAVDEPGHLELTFRR